MAASPKLKDRVVIAKVRPKFYFVTHANGSLDEGWANMHVQCNVSCYAAESSFCCAGLLTCPLLLLFDDNQ